MTIHELKYNYELNNPGGFFFARKTMKFFADTLSNFGVKKASIRARTVKGIETVEVYDLIRKKPVNGGLHGHCAYFRRDNFKVVFNHE
jgi:hypothetical protein